jgi:membrane protein DedA with SNARE-associated domain
MESALAWVSQYGYVAIFSLLVASIALPVPDDALLVFAGSLVSRGELALIPTIFSAFLGSLCGVTVSYALGRWFGVRLVDRLGRFVRADGATLTSARNWYRRRGKYTVFFGYFVPGLRHVAAFVAGSSLLPLPVFARLAYPGGLLWSVSMVAIGYLLGEEWARLSATVHRVLLTFFGVAAALLAVVALVVRRRRTS